MILKVPSLLSLGKEEGAVLVAVLKVSAVLREAHPLIHTLATMHDPRT